MSRFDQMIGVPDEALLRVSLACPRGRNTSVMYNTIIRESVHVPADEGGHSKSKFKQHAVDLLLSEVPSNGQQPDDEPTQREEGPTQVEFVPLLHEVLHSLATRGRLLRLRREPLDLVVRGHHRREGVGHDSDRGRAGGEVREALSGADGMAGGVAEVDVGEQPGGGDRGGARPADVVELCPLFGGNLGRGEGERRYANDGARRDEAYVGEALVSGGALCRLVDAYLRGSLRRRYRRAARYAPRWC